MVELSKMCELSKKAFLNLSGKEIVDRNKALELLAEGILNKKDEIISANLIDIRNAKENELSAPLIKRLEFNDKKLNELVEGIKNLIKLEDPLGKTQYVNELDEGLVLFRVTCPIGVIGVIYESRPDATVQISSLCLKSGNAVILKGGTEAKETNRVLFDIIKKQTTKAGMPENWVNMIEGRESVAEILKLDNLIDLIIPRGSNEFVKHVMANTKIPVLGHADGVCHCYIDEDCDIDMALNVVVDSKTQYVAVCNAAETILVNEKIAMKILPSLKEKFDMKNTKLLGCEKTCKIIDAERATEEDWSTEYLDYKISIRVVSDVKEACEHINYYGSGHTDTIITKNKNNALFFMDYVDSANVFWNCSTRFSDGFRYGFGAEVGISTSKIHARGPVGLEGLVTYKYKLIGKGHTVSDYASGCKNFKHKKLDIDFNDYITRQKM